MIAATIRDEQVVVAEHADPEPGTGEVLVRVRAAGLNTADIMQVAGRYPPPADVPQDIPGMEFAGEVVALGPQARRFSVGDKVMAIVGGGAQAQLVVSHERMLMAVPEGLTWAQAGGLPETFITAHDALFTQAGLQAGERVLIHGAAGGVGTSAVQMAHAAGARVTATVRNEAHREDVAKLGATVIAPEGFAGHGPFDVVLELVGGINMADNLKALEAGGRISVIGTGAGQTAELHLGLLMFKRARIFGSTLRARPLELKALASRALERSMLPLFASGALTVPIEASFPLSEVPAAYDRFRAGGKLGKIVVVND